MDYPHADLLQRYTYEPTPVNFVAIREAVAASSAYSPYSDDLRNAQKLAKQGRHEESLAAAQAAVGNRLLTPSLHILASAQYEMLNQPAQASRSMAVASLVADGILSTGDGSRRHPFLVMCTTDEYDILPFLNKQPARQSLVEDGDQHLDHHECTDGSELWFDISVAFQQLERAFTAMRGGPRPDRSTHQEPPQKWWQFWR